MRLHILLLFLCTHLVFSVTAQAYYNAQSKPIKVFEEGADNRHEIPNDIEQIEVRSKVLEQLSTSITQYTLSKELGLSALHAKNYDAALRLLTKSAKHGNKISQYYLAKMYFNGLGTPVNNELGWAWLNVALEQKTPDWKYAYHKISNAIPDEIKSHWEPTVAQYIASYGAKATNHKCRQKKEIGTNFITVQCERIHDGSYEHRLFRNMQELFFQP